MGPGGCSCSGFQELLGAAAARYQETVCHLSDAGKGIGDDGKR